MVSDSKSDVRKHRGFKSLPLRNLKKQLSHPELATMLWRCSSIRRVDRVAEGARLEIVSIARYRGFESLTLRKRLDHTRDVYGPG